MLTAQQVFDQTIDKIIAQGQPGVCVLRHSYERVTKPSLRGDNGTMCAVGQWLPDSHYDKTMDGYMSLTDALSDAPYETCYGEHLVREFRVGLGVAGVNMSDGLTRHTLHTLQRAHDAVSDKSGDAFVRGFLRKLNEICTLSYLGVALNHTHLKQRAQELGVTLPINKE